MGKNSSSMKIGILTAGGDCPGINAAIRGSFRHKTWEQALEYNIWSILSYL